MADKKTQAGFDFLVQALKTNKGATYADLRDKAEGKGFTVYPIMFGRAKAVLGLVKTKPRGQGKAAKTVASSKPGRSAGGGESKSERIRALLKSGMSVADIVKKVSCTPGLVYNVKSTMGKGGATKRGPGRPRKSASASAVASGLDGVIEALKNGERERAELTRALDRIRAVLTEVG